ncbi:MAG: alpha-galactosidase, partial [Eubacteriales bacterium]
TGAHMYRSTGDIFDNFESIKNIFLSQADKFNRSGPGCFNDIDMLVCGMYGKGNVGVGSPCGDTEYKTHFALWCLASSPLMIGGDVRNMSDYCHKLLTNPRLIAINQDPDARAPFEILTNYWNSGTMRRYVKMLADGDYIVGVFNFGDHECSVCVYEQELGFPVNSGRKLHLSDVFTGEDLGVMKDAYRVKLPAHDCAMIRIHVTRKAQ